MKFSEELALRLKGTTSEEIEELKKKEAEEAEEQEAEEQKESENSKNLELAQEMIKKLEDQIDESNSKLQEALKQIEELNNKATQSSGAEEKYDATSVLSELFNKKKEEN